MFTFTLERERFKHVSRSLLESDECLAAFDPRFRKNIIASMKDDEISKIVKNDQLILTVGEYLFQQKDIIGKSQITQRMRRLARLLLTLRNKYSGKPLKEWIFPSKFNILIEGINVLCEEVRNEYWRPTYNVPSLAMKVGQDLSACATALHAIAMREEKESDIKRYEWFLPLLKTELNCLITSAARKTLDERRISQSELLPFTSDVQMLITHTKNNILILVDEIKNEMTHSTYKKLITFMLGRIILFNKRRSGEASKLLVKQYKEKKHGQNAKIIPI